MHYIHNYNKFLPESRSLSKQDDLGFCFTYSFYQLHTHRHRGGSVCIQWNKNMCMRSRYLHFGLGVLVCNRCLQSACRKVSPGHTRIMSIHKPIA